MDLNALSLEITGVLDTIAGLRVTQQPPESLTPPATWLEYPQEVNFDETYGRGMDRIPDWEVFAVVGKVTSRSGRQSVYEYASATGAKSLKAVLEAHTWAACDVLRVSSVEFGYTTVAGIDYVSAKFHLDIAGQGTA